MAATLKNHKVKIISILLLVILILSLHLYQRQISTFFGRLTLGTMRIQAPTVKQVSPQLTAVKKTEVKTVGAVAKKTFSIQLLGSRSRSDLVRVIKQHNWQKFTHIRQVQYLKRPWFILLIGNYHQYAEAKAVFDLLPRSIKAFHPWIRPQ